MSKLLKTMQPKHNTGEYVFCVTSNLNTIDANDIIMMFREEEGLTVILKKEVADHLQLNYPAVFSWITLTVHSSLQAVGLTAAFSTALAAQGVSCNVVAAYFHDHIFVGIDDIAKAMAILNGFSMD